MKIVHIVEAFTAGVFNIVTEIANQQSQQHEVYIIYATRPTTVKNYIDYVDKKVKLIHSRYLTREINPIMDLQACFEISKTIKKIKPDVIHMHSTKAGAVGRIALSGRKYVLLYAPHAYSFLLMEVSNVKRRLYYILERILGLRKCTTIADGISEYEMAKKITKWAVCIDNGIDLKKMDEILLNCENKEWDNPPIYFMIGRICEQKNPRLFNKLAEHFPENHFVWVGEGELRSELKSSNIEVTGWLSKEDALKKISKCDILIFTTLYEGLSVAMLEMMYMRKLCIVNDVDGVKDAIINGENGYLCDGYEDFVEMMTKCNTKNLPVEKLIDNAYKEIINHYNTERRANELDILINRSVNKSNT